MDNYTTKETQAVTEAEVVHKNSRSKFPKLFVIIILFLLGLVVASGFLLLENLSLKKQAGVAPKTLLPKSCSYNGVEYKPGDSVPSLDKCNSCSCTDTGDIACTAMACEEKSLIDDHAAQKKCTPEYTSENLLLYEAEDYRFSYPSGVTLVEEKTVESEGSSGGQYGFSQGSVSLECFLSGAKDYDYLNPGYHVGINRLKPYNSENAKQTISHLYGEAKANCGSEEAEISLKNINFSGKPAYQLTVNGCIGYIDQQTILIDVDENTVLWLDQDRLGESQAKKNYNEITSKILSTFKFIE